MRALDRANQLIQFYLDRFGVPVLRILNQEDHEKRHDRGASIDHQLPGVAKTKERAGHRPNEDESDRQHKADRWPVMWAAHLEKRANLEADLIGRIIFSYLVTAQAAVLGGQFPAPGTAR